MVLDVGVACASPSRSLKTSSTSSRAVTHHPCLRNLPKIKMSYACVAMPSSAGTRLKHAFLTPDPQSRKAMEFPTEPLLTPHMEQSPRGTVFRRTMRMQPLAAKDGNRTR
jgi:hypothetical protein